MRRLPPEAAPPTLYVEQHGRPSVRPATAEQVEEIQRLRLQGYTRVVVGPNRRARRAARRRP